MVRYTPSAASVRASLPTVSPSAPTGREARTDTPEPAPPAPPAPTPPAPTRRRALVPAGMSSNPEVQHLIADLHAASLNGDAAQVERCTEAITALGYYV